jgi:hypothetical protein
VADLPTAQAMAELCAEAFSTLLATLHLPAVNGGDALHTLTTTLAQFWALAMHLQRRQSHETAPWPALDHFAARPSAVVLTILTQNDGILKLLEPEHGEPGQCQGGGKLPPRPPLPLL